MEYIAVKRYRRDDDRGTFNISYGSRLTEIDGTLYYDGRAVCGDHSAVMRDYFARNDDGLGLQRGKLTREICGALAIRRGETREQHGARWAPVWKDAICNRYRKPGQVNHWLWSIEFFNAPIADLHHIARLVGAKGV